MKIAALLAIAGLVLIPAAQKVQAATITPDEQAEVNGWRACFADQSAQACAGEDLGNYWQGFQRACGFAPPPVIIDDAVVREKKRELHDESFPSEINAVYEGLQHLCSSSGHSYKPLVGNIKAVHFVVVAPNQLPHLSYSTALLRYDAGRKELVIGENEKADTSVEEYLVDWAPRNLPH